MLDLNDTNKTTYKSLMVKAKLMMVEETAPNNLTWIFEPNRYCLPSEYYHILFLSPMISQFDEVDKVKLCYVAEHHVGQKRSEQGFAISL